MRISVFFILIYLYNHSLSFSAENKSEKDDSLSIELNLSDKKNEKEEIKKDIEEKDQKKIDKKFRMKIGGSFNLQYGYTSNNGRMNSNGLGFVPQTIQGTKGDFFTDSFNVYGGTIDLSPEIEINKHKFGIFLRMPFTQTSNSDIRSASQQYIYLDTNEIFKLELGSTFGVATKMKVDPYNISSGDKGAYGDWWRYINIPTYNTSGLGTFNSNSLNYGFGPTFMIYPGLPHEAGFTTGDVLNQGYISNQNPYNTFNTSNFSTSIQGIPIKGARSNKISLYTARFYGFQIGFTYSPDTNNSGVFQGFSNSSISVGGGVRNYIAVALNYKKQFGNIGTAFSFTYENGTPKDAINLFTNGNNSSFSTDDMVVKRNRLSAFAFGGQLSYKNFAIAYSFIYWGNSLNAKSGFLYGNGYDFQDIANKTSFAHVAAFGANYGPINFSMQYMHSSRMGNTADLFSIGTDINIGNLKYIKIQPYFEYTFALLKPNYFGFTGSQVMYQANTLRTNIVIVGIKASF